MIKLLSPGEVMMYVTLTNYMAIFGGIGLWAAFFLLGMIARRLERAFEIPTHWQLLCWAPSGILLYTIYTLAQAGTGSAALGAFHVETYVAYGALLVSGLGCTWGCLATLRLLARIARTPPPRFRSSM